MQVRRRVSKPRSHSGDGNSTLDSTKEAVFGVLVQALVDTGPMRFLYFTALRYLPSPHKFSRQVWDLQDIRSFLVAFSFSAALFYCPFRRRHMQLLSLFVCTYLMVQNLPEGSTTCEVQNGLLQELRVCIVAPYLYHLAFQP